MAETDQLTEQRPYRGMQKFSEEHKNLFFGRTKPINEIFGLLKNNILTVIFGMSGIGKSSLINAGLLPKLRQNFYLPILIRIPFSEPGIDPLAFTQGLIETEIKKYISKDFTYPKEQTLWQFFREADITGGAVIPVLIFDQFEEYFNFSKSFTKQVDKFIQQLSDLIENRIPAGVKDIDRNKITPAAEAQNHIRIIISLREDFLARLEDLSKLIPSLNKIRYRMLPLRGNEAFDAIYLPGKNFIDEATSILMLKKMIPEKIAAEVGKTQGSSEEENDWENKEYEPYIVSLFCYQVNEKRIALKQDKITGALVDATRVKTILSDYYNDTLKKYQHTYGGNIGEILENNLVNAEGYRLLKPVNASEFHDIPKQAIKDMVDDRIIQVVNRNDINNIEISHDLLAKVVYEKKLDKKKDKKLYYVVYGLIALIAAVVFFSYSAQERTRTELVAKADSLVVAYNVAARDSVAKDSLSDKLNNTLLEIKESYNGTIYFQVSGDPAKQPQLKLCMDELRDLKFVVPSAEVITKKPFKNMIKFYYEEDKATAKKIQSVCEKYYAAVPPQFIKLTNNKVSPGTIEVWVNYEHHYQQLFSATPSVSNNAKGYLISAYKSVDKNTQWPKQMITTARANASNEAGIENTLYVFSKMDAAYLSGDKDLILAWLQEVAQQNKPGFTMLIEEIRNNLNTN